MFIKKNLNFELFSGESESITRNNPIISSPIIGSIEQINQTTQNNPIISSPIIGSTEQINQTTQNNPIIGELNFGSTINQTTTQNNPIIGDLNIGSTGQINQTTQNNPIIGLPIIGSAEQNRQITQNNLIIGSPIIGSAEQINQTTQNNPIIGDLNIGSIEQINQTTTQNNPISGELNFGSTGQINQCDNCEWKLNKAKILYKQFESVNYPSSLLTDENGYISRDYVCYRKHAGDINFVSNRPMCMACTINNDNSIDPITKTNIKTTCVYGSDDKSLKDQTIWNEKKCIDTCKLLQE